MLPVVEPVGGRRARVEIGVVGGAARVLVRHMRVIPPLAHRTK
jgi:hypothetical protein